MTSVFAFFRKYGSHTVTRVTRPKTRPYTAKLSDISWGRQRYIRVVQRYGASNDFAAVLRNCINR
jgi:ribosomal protein L44E